MPLHGVIALCVCVCVCMWLLLPQVFLLKGKGRLTVLVLKFFIPPARPHYRSSYNKVYPLPCRHLVVHSFLSYFLTRCWLIGTVALVRPPSNLCSPELPADFLQCTFLALTPQPHPLLSFSDSSSLMAEMANPYTQTASSTPAAKQASLVIMSFFSPDSTSESFLTHAPGNHYQSDDDDVQKEDYLCFKGKFHF